MSRTGSILIVDDDFATRDSMGEVLRLEGYDVVDAPDGPTSLALLRARPREIALVLLDLMMPGMSGVDVLDEKQRDAEISDIPVIVMTGYTEATLKMYGGVIALMVKARLAELLTVVRACTGQSPPPQQ